MHVITMYRVLFSKGEAQSDGRQQKRGKVLRAPRGHLGLTAHSCEVPAHGPRLIHDLAPSVEDGCLKPQEWAASEIFLLQSRTGMTA